jgi:hypothetical protein
MLICAIRDTQSLALAISKKEAGPRGEIRLLNLYFLGLKTQGKSRPAKAIQPKGLEPFNAES